MLPVQKRKAPPSSPGSPPSAKNARAVATTETQSRAADRGKGVWRKPPASPTRAPGSPHDGATCNIRPEATAPADERRTQAGGVDEEKEEAREQPGTGRMAGGNSSPSDTMREASCAELTPPTTVGAQDKTTDNQLAGEPSSAGQASEAPPAVSSTSGTGSSPGPSEERSHSAGPEVPSRLDGPLPTPEGRPEGHKGTPSDDEMDEGDRNLVITIEEGESASKRRRKKVLKREKKAKEGKSAEERRPDCDIQLDDSFERALEDGAKTHNLTAINVRNILHEVITNEHVVAMVKAAIFDTEQPHLFEPKMTRSKLKEVVEKGVFLPPWNISPIKSKESKPPQFIDIPLEEEDSSDEEYRPEEEEEDETAEEGYMESDAESTSSSPAGGRRPRSRLEVLETEEDSATGALPSVAEKEKGASLAARHLSVESVPMGPPPLPPKAKHKPTRDSSFMEKLHAVDEELASNEVCMDSYQSLDECLIAYRTRSKWPLNNVSLGLLEAELKAPDITADMYDQATQDDVHWQSWMKAVMNDLDYEDDEDDPEYNFLEDLDEPDMEDFRNDRAVQITKKEVNELMEELFETFQDEMGVPDVEEEGADEETPDQTHNTFNTPQAMRFEEPLANILTEQHRTVKAQIEQLRQRKVKQQALVAESKPACGRSPQPETLTLDQNQKRQLQQQMQQHVQLLSQVHLLTSVNPGLRQEADMSLLFLKELASFAEKASELYSTQGPDFTSSFAPCNLTDALALLEEFDKSVKPHVKIPPPKDEQKMNRQFDESNYLPREVAWILATRDVFMYPELLPHCSLQPKQPKDKASFSKGEGNLLVLGLKHFEGTDFPKPLISQYLMPPKTDHQLSVRIKNLSVSRAPDNVIKLFKKKKVVEPMPSPFTAVGPEDRRPAIEREENKLPYWLQRSLPSIRRWLEQSKEPASRGGEGSASGTDTDTPSLEPVPTEGAAGEGSAVSGQSAAPPLLIPLSLTLLLKPKHSHLGQREVRWRRRRPTAGKPVLIHPAVKKVPPKQLAPVLSLKQGARPPPRLIQPAPPPVIPQAPGLPPLAVTKPPASPWLLTVPPGVQLVSLSGGCNVIDVPAGQTLRVATMVVRPTAFTCPVNARLPSPGGASGALSERPLAPGGSPLPGAEVPNRCDPEKGAADPPRPGEVGAADRLSGREGEQAKEAPCPQSANVGLPPKVEAGKTDPAADPGDRPGVSEPPAPGHKEPPGGEEGQGPPGSGSLSGAPQRQPPAGKQQLILGLGQELDIDAAQETPTQPPPRQPGPSAPAGNPSTEEDERESAAQGNGEDRPHSPRTAGADEERQPEKSRECVSAEELAVSAEELAVSPEELAAQVDKAGQEEEEDEDLDDLTQDEEDEEVLSSASEESALSVPELQETMEKLTWLASERRLSQEGDSEEENSQEENSEPEEEEEAEGLDLLQKETGRGTREMAEKERRDTGYPTTRRQINTSSCLRGEVRKLSGKGKAACRSRAKRGRRRISKDTSKLLLLYDEDILNNDPLREQKDMAFAQAYLSKVREALQDVPGKYEDFLRILYDFETNPDQRTAVDLYGDLCDIIQDWPQLLKDFAAFLLPEQALQCGLFEEQQAFDKSRKFLRQLEICFGENPSQYQKIIKALQSCMVCSAPDMAELKVQVWQLLKGHHHLQDEFSLFFDNLRPPSSRMSDFEEVNWMEDKEYEFDGFEEVVLPDLEEEEELQKITPPPRSKRRREGHTHEKSVDTKASKGKDSVAAGVPDAWITAAGAKEVVKGSDPVEGSPEEAQVLGLNSKDSSSPGTRAPGSNTPRGCEETQPGRGPRLPGDSCCLEEVDENGVRVSQRVNETPVSPLRSADEIWSPASEGDGSESQGPEVGLADGSDPVPHSPCCPWREEPGRRRGRCPCDSTRPETGVGGKEEWTEPGMCCRDMAALPEGEDAAKDGGPPPLCRSAVCEEGDTLSVHGAPNVTREAASSKLELANAASGVWSDGPRGRGRHSTEHVAGYTAPPVETPAPLRGRDCGVALVVDTSPWEAGVQRDRKPEERTTLAETGSAPREPPRNPAGHASVKFATAGAQVRFMSCQKLSDLLPVDLQLTLAHGHSRDAGSLDSADHEPPRGQATAIPSPRLWETWEGAARDRLVTSSATTGSESPLRHTDSRASSTGEQQEDEQDRQAQAAVCAKNSRLSSTGERVVLWTREADRAILTACRESGANEDTFSEVAQQLNSKSVQEVSQRFRELMYLFHTSGDVSTDEEEDTVSVSNPEEQE